MPEHIEFNWYPSLEEAREKLGLESVFELFARARFETRIQPCGGDVTVRTIII